MKLPILILLMLCSDVRCYLEFPPAPPPPAPTPQAQPTQPTPLPTQPPPPTTGPFLAIGLPWRDTSDPGYCPGFTPYEGNTPPPLLSWPIDVDEIRPNRGYRIGHPALDLDAPTGTPVKAAASGLVVWAGWTSFGLGEVVFIHHGGGWLTGVAHLSAVLAECGEWVGAGTVVGLVGMSGASTFAHTHFILRRGVWDYNPLAWLW